MRTYRPIAIGLEVERWSVPFGLYVPHSTALRLRNGCFQFVWLQAVDRAACAVICDQLQQIAKAEVC